MKWSNVFDMNSIVRIKDKLIQSQKILSKYFDSYFPIKFQLDGNSHFCDSVVPAYLRRDDLLYDVGGGKQPYLSPITKKEHNYSVIGLDISQSELDKAPDGSYDSTIATDVERYSGKHNADIVLCQSLLEHVKNTEAAIRAFSSIVKPGGYILIFVPSRRALFARLNLLLPEDFKRWLLYTIHPNTKRTQGFPAYYDRCTPSELIMLSEKANLEVVSLIPYYKSSYFSFFFPLYVLWRFWVVVQEAFYGEEAAETFSLVLRMPFNE